MAGIWPRSPLGAFADVMVERPDGHRLLGLEFTPDRLLAADWSPLVREEHVVFVFDGGELTDDDLDAIELRSGDVDSWAFLAPEELFVMLEPRLTRRVSSALDARVAGRTDYLENGTPA